MNNLIPDSGFLRLTHILGNPKADPPIPPLIPVSKSTWWAGVKSGRFPKPLKPFGPRITVWRAEDIQALINAATESSGDDEHDASLSHVSNGRESAKHCDADLNHAGHEPDQGAV